MSDIVERAKKRIENPPSETRLGFTDAEVWELIKELKSVKKERDQFKQVVLTDENHAEKLEAENAELVPLIQKNTALTRENAELKESNKEHLSAAISDVDILNDLKAQLAENEKKVEELKQRLYNPR